MARAFAEHLDPAPVSAILIAAAVAALLVALGLQYLGGLAPCELCVLGRYPYVLVIVAAALGLTLRRPRLGLAVALVALLVGAGIAAYHVGVEEGVFALPQSCGALGPASSIEDLRAQLATAPPRCDQVSASFLGLSLAAWNGLYALGLTVLAGTALLRRSAAEQDRNPGVT